MLVIVDVMMAVGGMAEDVAVAVEVEGVVVVRNMVMEIHVLVVLVVEDVTKPIVMVVILFSMVEVVVMVEGVVMAVWGWWCC